MVRVTVDINKLGLDFRKRYVKFYNSLTNLTSMRLVTS